MSILKNPIPILEFDEDPTAVLMPEHEGLDFMLPEKAVFLFLAETVEHYAAAHSAKCVGYFESATKAYPIYVLNYKNEDIVIVQAPVGAAPAAQILDWLSAYGVKKVISAGSCGTLRDLPENRFLIPVKALRDEGTSYHYLAPSRYVDIDPEAIRAIKTALEHTGHGYEEVVTWSTDGFFRETKEKVAYRKAEGCSVVEMECSALAAVAKMRGILWGELLYTADSLADTLNYDSRDWGDKSREIALALALDAVRLMS